MVRFTIETGTNLPMTNQSSNGMFAVRQLAGKAFLYKRGEDKSWLMVGGYDCMAFDSEDAWLFSVANGKMKIWDLSKVPPDTDTFNPVKVFDVAVSNPNAVMVADGFAYVGDVEGKVHIYSTDDGYEAKVLQVLENQPVTRITQFDGRINVWGPENTGAILRRG